MNYRHFQPVVSGWRAAIVGGRFVAAKPFTLEAGRLGPRVPQ
jgi:hypothetical protein